MGIARHNTQSDDEAVLDTSTGESQAPGALELDPFGYYPGAASRIGGLGGTGASPTPEYVFHTPYVEAAPGRATFKLRFEGLRARNGTLVVRIHMLSREPGARSRLVNSERIALNRLIQFGSQMEIGFEGFHDVIFALVGVISGETDAEADTIVVSLDNPADPTAEREHFAEAKSTAYGNTPLEPAAFLLSTVKPTLADPVTQIATAAQLREHAAGAWLARLRPKGNSGVEHWRKVYTLQVLRRYGMLEPGAVGLGFEPSPSGMPAALAAMDANVVTLFPIKTGPQPNVAAIKEDLQGRAPCDITSFTKNVSVQLASWRRIPRNLVNFDFVWSARANEQLYSVAAATQFVDEAMTCLRPGGIAVHTMSYDLSPGGRSTPSTERILLQQGDVERIALILVSRGHEVAQFKFEAYDPLLIPGAAHGAAQRTMVGFIIRKARLPD